MKNHILIKQHDVTDCGAACLASISAYYKKQVPVARIRQYAGTDTMGTNILGLIQAAEKIGFDARAVKGQPEALAQVPLPAIVHVITKKNSHHFLVLYKVSGKTVLIMDPSDGKMHKYKPEDFYKIWTGVIVIMFPCSRFETGSNTLPMAARFYQLIQPHKSIMLEALLGALIYTILGLSTSVYVQKIVDFVFIGGNVRLLNLLSIIMIIILFFQMIIGAVKTIMVIRTGQFIDARLILGYYRHLLNLPQKFFDTMRVGEIISRVNDAVKIRFFINDVAMSLAVNILMVVCAAALMFLYYWKLALIMMMIIPVFMLIYYINNRFNKKWQRRLMEDHAELETQLVESLQNAATIKQFMLEQYANNKTENRFIRLLKTSYAAGIFSIYIGSSSEFVNRFITIIILWSGSYFVLQRELSPGELLSFYSLIAYFTGPVSALISANRNIQEAVIAADRLFEIIDLETENEESVSLELEPVISGNIRFQNVSFSYNNRSEVFRNLSFEIETGKLTALVGNSGSGKSTILALLQQLYPIRSGSLHIGNIDIRHISKESLRSVVSSVPQQIELFKGTIVENIAIGDPEPDMSHIWNLCCKLGMNEFIESLPAGYMSMIGERGVNISGGQRQRIAIARALYRKPSILLLDEPTSSLDAIAEERVRQTLYEYKGTGATVIIIAHRLTTVKTADQIIVLENGSVCEQGTHNELLLKEGNYSRLWNPQSFVI